MRKDDPLAEPEMRETDARRILALRGSAAQDPARYRAHRYDVGWVFSWAVADTELPMGEAPWVVTDTGVAKRVPIGWDSVAFLRKTAEDESFE
jgi:hypothetical protein